MHAPALHMSSVLQLQRALAARAPPAAHPLKLAAAARNAARLAVMIWEEGSFVGARYFVLPCDTTGNHDMEVGRCQAPPPGGPSSAAPLPHTTCSMRAHCCRWLSPPPTPPPGPSRARQAGAAGAAGPAVQPAGATAAQRVDDVADAQAAVAAAGATPLSLSRLFHAAICHPDLSLSHWQQMVNAPLPLLVGQRRGSAAHARRASASVWAVACPCQPMCVYQMILWHMPIVVASSCSSAGAPTRTSCGALAPAARRRRRPSPLSGLLQRSFPASLKTPWPCSFGRATPQTRS